PTEAALAHNEGRGFETADQILARLAPEPSINRAGRSGRADRSEIRGLTSLPEGWAWARMDEVGDVTLGRQRAPQHHHGPHMRPYLRVANVFEDRLDLSDVQEMNFTP